MLKNEAKKGAGAPVIKKILITQPRPESDKSPYFELGRKFGVTLDFHPFISLEGIPAKDFRKQKIEISHYSAVIFLVTSTMRRVISSVILTEASQERDRKIARSIWS